MASNNINTKLNSIVLSQNQYFKTNITKSKSWRINQLNCLKKFIQVEKQSIIQCLKSDLKALDFLSELGGLSLISQSIEFSLRNLDKWIKPQSKSINLTVWPAKAYTVKEPLGVCAIFGVWNFPFYTLLNPMVGAISAGNCVILKPSEMAVASAKFLHDTLPKYMDIKAIQIVNGGVETATKLLSQRLDHIFYTGSPRVGKIVMTAAAKNLTPVVLELGGKNPVLICDSANIHQAAKRILWGKLQNMGQACIGPDYVLLPKTLKSQFISSLKFHLFEFLGPDFQSSKDLSRIINTRHFDRLANLLKKEKGQVVAGGKMNRADLYIDPTVILTNLDSPFMQEEIFGPILPIILVDSVKESLDIVNKFEKPLALYIFSSNEKEIQEIMLNTSSGGVTINDVIMHGSLISLPFGGVGHSGMGKYNQKYSFDCFSNERSVLRKSTWGDFYLRYPPYSARNVMLLKRLAQLGIGGGKIYKVGGMAVLLGMIIIILVCFFK